MSRRNRRTRFSASVRNSQRAFSLTELVVVMALVVILAGSAYPVLGWIDGARQDMAASRIRSALIYAQSWSMDHQLQSWVLFDPDRDEVTVFAEDPLKPGKAQRLPMQDPHAGGALHLDLGAIGADLVQVDIGGGPEVLFDARGKPYDKAGSALVRTARIALFGGSQVLLRHGTGLVTVD